MHYKEMCSDGPLDDYMSVITSHTILVLILLGSLCPLLTEEASSHGVGGCGEPPAARNCGRPPRVEGRIQAARK